MTHTQMSYVYINRKVLMAAAFTNIGTSHPYKSEMQRFLLSLPMFVCRIEILVQTKRRRAKETNSDGTYLLSCSPLNVNLHNKRYYSLSHSINRYTQCPYIESKCAQVNVAGKRMSEM